LIRIKRKQAAGTDTPDSRAAPHESVHEKRNLLVDAAILAALLAIGAAGYWFSPLLLPPADVVALPDAGCDLHVGPCVATLADGGRIQLSITPRPIPTVKPLEIEVQTVGIEPRKVEIDFAGVVMNMGYNRTTLGAAGPGRFAGSASLPVCITGAMLWQATLLVEAGRSRISIPFRFESGPHRS